MKPLWHNAFASLVRRLTSYLGDLVQRRRGRSGSHGHSVTKGTLLYQVSPDPETLLGWSHCGIG